MPKTSPSTVSMAMMVRLVPRMFRSKDGSEAPSRTREYLSQKLLSDIVGGRKF